MAEATGWSFHREYDPRVKKYDSNFITIMIPKFPFLVNYESCHCTHQVLLGVNKSPLINPFANLNSITSPSI